MRVVFTKRWGAYFDGANPCLEDDEAARLIANGFAFRLPILSQSRSPSQMNHKTTVSSKSTTLPVTLAEAKNHLRIIGDDLDTDVQGLLRLPSSGARASRGGRCGTRQHSCNLTSVGLSA